MKKIGLMVVAVALSLSAAAFAGQDQPKAERPASKGKAVRGAEAQSPKALASQIAQLKQEHQAAISELDEIKKLANEEKATKTAGALDKLIARRNQEFQKRIEPLQQRLNKLEGRAKGGDKDKTNGDKGKTEEKGKGKGKTKGTPKG
jgi:vacuolar-type H+-ATPase subunit I/STV1